MILLSALLGCSFQPPEGPATEVYSGNGWSMRVPAGAAVVAKPRQVSVDPAAGTSWFDVRWLPNGLPVAQATAWGQEFCRPIQWDTPYTTAGGAWFAGGICTVGYRRHWTMVLVEPRGEQTLLTAYVASFGRVTYEEAWSEFATSALSVTVGAKPAVPMRADAVIEALRGTSRDDLAGAVRPIPGGGLFSGMAAANLEPLWAAHLTQNVPEAFAVRDEDSP